jgi:hypothetical protein
MELEKVSVRLHPMRLICRLHKQNNFSMSERPEYINGLPNICGSEVMIAETLSAFRGKSVFLHESGTDFGNARGCCAIALHMHQPLIPAGGPGRGSDMRHEPLVGNLQFMQESPYEEDRHNADIFRRCYKRMGEFVPQLVEEGKNPRVMLDYTGTLLHGLCRMGAYDVIDSLRTITCNPRYQRCVEWLGTTWGHAVAPSTPHRDYRLHIRAWQHHFSAIFGLETLSRVRGFVPSELALPNHPDAAYEFVKSVRDCGFLWMIVQEHSVERPRDGWGTEWLHIPNRLVCRNSGGEQTSIICLIKTRGSDTKLIGQMQPYDEAYSQSRWDYAGRKILPMVTQISDGENGHVMMNEFPFKYFQVAREASWTDVPMVNATEYLEYLFASGWKEEDFPIVQPIRQKRIWDRYKPGEGAEKLNQVIDELAQEDPYFHTEGGSWTNNISWLYGYDNVDEPMLGASALFDEKAVNGGVPSWEHRYRNALFHLLAAQSSCFRYWGQGRWADYGVEICRRAIEILMHDFA